MPDLVPRATYRIQLHPGFGFDAASAVLDYLAALGVSHAYCSPYLQAAPGSTHGYDVVDPHRINRELGGEEGHARFLKALAANGLGQLLDVVPNHMSISGPENRWWWDVLENGRSSQYALYFDVAWDPPDPRLKNRVLLPILGDHYGRVLARRELQLERERGRFRARYLDQLAPLAPHSLQPLLEPVPQLRGLAAELAALPTPAPDDLPAIEARHRQKEELLDRLAAELDRPELARPVDRVLAEVNADPDRLDLVLERQHYRIARWQTAGWDLDYRRFFDINTLAAVRVGDPRVFEDTHRLVLGWLREGSLDGVRIDHPDGLRDPKGYFERLRCEAPAAWIVVEKILEPGEPLPADWPVQGTTGYDFANRCLGVLIDPAGEGPLTELYRELTGEASSYPEIAHAKKHQVLSELLASDLNRLVALLLQVCERHRDYRDYTRRELDHAVREVIACFPVYRTYVRPTAGEVSADDRRHVAEASSAARENRHDLDPDLFDFIRDLLLLVYRGDVEDEFVWRFQLTTGPVMAKAVEDTAFYTYNRLVCLNEVGGDPSRFGLTTEEFHEACAEALAWPRAMLAGSTHDTKRSEDVRARLAVLAEAPDRWRATVTRWMEMNQHLKTGGAPDANTEYLLYQTLVGAYPLETERAVAYMEKASKEAKVNTSWLSPDPDFDAALRSFVEAVCEDPDFTSSLRAFANFLTQPGRVNSLSMKLLTLTAPGVGDIYQGSELWDLSLVDPDNRRPVDYERRRRLLAELDSIGGREAWERVDEGLPKLMVVSRALRLRAERPQVFDVGGYRGLAATGRQAQRVVAFTRAEEVVVVVPRLVLGLGAGWGDTTLQLPGGRWDDRLGGGAGFEGRIALAELLDAFPVALLARAG